MILQRNTQRLGHRVQRMFGLRWQHHSRHPHRVHIGEIMGNSLPVAIFHDKTHVEPGIVGYQHTPLAEAEKLRQHALDLLRVDHHIVLDARQLLDLERDRHLRIDEHRKAVYDLTAADLHRADLYDSVFHWGKARGLDIEHHEILAEILPLVIGGDLMQIVHQIGFHPVDHLEKVLLVRVRISRLFALVLLRFPQIFPDMVGVRKRLHHAVIRDGDRRMSPLISPLDNILGLGHAVHIAHLRMTVQLHPLTHTGIQARCGKIRYLLDPR